MVVRLLDEGKSWKYIMEEAHVSPNTLTKISEKWKQANTPAQISKRSQSLKMLNAGHSLYEIAVRLDISEEEVTKYQTEYYKLQTGQDFSPILKDRNLLSALLSINHDMKVRGLSVDDLNRALKIMPSVESLRLESAQLESKIIFHRKL